MPWFESSKDKQFRELIQGKMEICISKPDKYQQAFPVLNSLVVKPNQKAIEMIVGHIKQVIKQDDYTPQQKLQAMILLRDLMASQSKALGKYVVTKILKRLIILAQHRKSEKDEKRGANIFKCKKSEEKYGIQFLKVLLLCLADWGKNWPRNADGPFHDFQVAYNDLLLQKQVAFPPEQKKPSKSPPPTGFRASRQQYGSSPPKMPMNEKRIQNPLSKPVIKQKKLLAGPMLSYVNQMIDLLELLSTTLKQNPQMGDMWDIIKSIVDQFKSIDEQGNLLAAQMLQSGEQNQQVSTIIQNNSIFITKIKEDTRKVDNNKDNYGAYNNKYVMNCKKLILSMSMYTNKPSSSSLPSNSNSNNASATIKPQPVAVETSINEKVEQVKPKVQAQKNRYGSSQGLRNQLTNNLSLKKEDFNSGNLKQVQNSQASSRYNSISGNPLGKHRESDAYANNSTQKKQIKQPTKIPPQNAKSALPKVEQVPTQKQDFFNQSDNQIKTKPLPKQISKITQKNQNQSEKNFNNLNFENSKEIEKKKNNDASFGQFEPDSNSNFFKQVENKNIGQVHMGARKNRKVGNKKAEQANNFFDPFDEKSKPNSDNLSGFEKSKQQKSNSNSAEAKKSYSQEKKGQTSNQQGFDTFKNPNEIAKAILQLNKSVASNGSKVSNPFSEHNKSKDNPFATKFQFGQNSFNRSQKSRDEQRKNEFNNDSGRFGQADNPFAGQISQIKPKREQNDDNNSKKSNPFSKYDQDNKSQQKSSIRSKPPIPRKKSELSANPFDAKSQNDRLSEKNTNPFGTSFLSNPFEKAEKVNSKQLSQRGSFVNVNNAGASSLKNINNVMDDPFFQPSPQFNKPYNTISNSLEFNKRTSLQQKSKVQKSFDGFNFDDFPNVGDRRSSTSSLSQQNNQNWKQNQQKIVPQFRGKIQNPAVNSIFNQNVFEQTKKSQQIKQKASSDSFNFSEPTKKADESKDFFENSKKDIVIQQKPKEISKQQSFQLGFDDFPNVSSNSGKQSSKNPFSNFETSNGAVEIAKLQKQPVKQQNIKQVQFDKQQLNKSEDSWSKFGKPGLNQSDIWNKFVNIQQKKSQHDASPHGQVHESRYEPSENKSVKSDTKQVPWFDEPKKDIKRDSQQNQNQAEEPHFGNSQKSISIHFQQVSAFQKKQIPWQHFSGDLSSTRYNITPEAIEEKKQALLKSQQQNKSRIIKYRQMNEKLDFLKKQYAKRLEKLSQSREQKHQYLLILKRMQEGNQNKQRQIQQEIKKIKKAEDFKKRILENQRILYERLKTEKKPKQPSTGSNIPSAGTKWERFNNNLRKQRQMVQFGKPASNFSYFA